MNLFQIFDIILIEYRKVATQGLKELINMDRDWFLMKIPTNRTLIMKDDYSDIRYALCVSMGMMFERVVDQKDLIDFFIALF